MMVTIAAMVAVFPRRYCINILCLRVPVCVCWPFVPCVTLIYTESLTVKLSISPSSYADVTCGHLAVGCCNYVQTRTSHADQSYCRLATTRINGWLNTRLLTNSTLVLLGEMCTRMQSRSRTWSLRCMSLCSVRCSASVCPISYINVDN